jgi:glycosyltransferase involved in cell wall biosynthesis
MPQPKVSVCIPTYNRSRYLARAVSSVLEQTFEDFELVVVDNASVDDTSQVMAALKDKRIRYHRNESNLGMVGNWNRCVQLAQADYVAILHDDDLWSEHYLARVVPVLERHGNVGLAYSAAFIVDGEGKPHHVHTHWTEDRIINGEVEFRELIINNKILCPTVTVRRTCYERLGVFDESILLGADWEMWLRICLYYDVVYIAEPLAYYRMRYGSISDELDASQDGENFKWDDACDVVEKGMLAAHKAGLPELVTLARRSLANFHFRIAYENRRMADPLAAIKHIRQALANRPMLVFLRLRLILKILVYTILGCGRSKG